VCHRILHIHDALLENRVISSHSQINCTSSSVFKTKSIVLPEAA
jgi:hypothetical protein